MKLLYFILLFTFVCLSLNCEKSNKDISSNENRINNSENVEKFEHIDKAKEIETLKNPYEVGQKDAQDDISNGRFLIIMNGDPTEVASEWRNVLKGKHGIEIYNFGCCFSDKVSKYVKGYNDVSEVAIKKKFGRYVLDDTWKEAEQIVRNK